MAPDLVISHADGDFLRSVLLHELSGVEDTRWRRRGGWAVFVNAAEDRFGNSPRFRHGPIFWRRCEHSVGLTFEWCLYSTVADRSGDGREYRLSYGGEVDSATARGFPRSRDEDAAGCLQLDCTRAGFYD